VMLSPKLLTMLRNWWRVHRPSRGPLPVRLSYHVSRVTSSGLEAVAFDNERTLLTTAAARTRRSHGQWPGA
jgi:hypothetical protein